VTRNAKGLLHLEKRRRMMEQDFSCRSHQLEMMDGDAIGFEDFQNCLRGLEIVNVCTLAYRPTLHWLKKTLSDVNSRQPVSILDVGSGGGRNSVAGDVLQVHAWSQIARTRAIMSYSPKCRRSHSC
jgi:hypothetical protein